MEEARRVFRIILVKSIQGKKWAAHRDATGEKINPRDIEVTEEELEPHMARFNESKIP